MSNACHLGEVDAVFAERVGNTLGEIYPCAIRLVEIHAHLLEFQHRF